MAQSTKVAILLISIFLLACLVQSKPIPFPSGVGNTDAENVVSCSQIHGTQEDETCTSIAKDFEVSFAQFLTINPNVNCDSIFVGQWICVSGAIGN